MTLKEALKHVGGAITANDGTGGHRWTGTLDHGAWREC